MASSMSALEAESSLPQLPVISAEATGSMEPSTPSGQSDSGQVSVSYVEHADHSAAGSGDIPEERQHADTSRDVGEVPVNAEVCSPSPFNEGFSEKLASSATNKDDKVINLFLNKHGDRDAVRGSLEGL